LKFFLPHVTDLAEAESAYADIKAFAEKTTGWKVSNRRIYRLEFVHNGKHYTAEVGQPTDFNHEEVIAILDSDPHLIYTLLQGVICGDPIYIGRHLVRRREDFA
jgi:hypothetical protein